MSARQFKFYREEDVKARFESRYIPEPNSGCWLWLGGTNGNDYGVLMIARGKLAYAHRLSYQWKHGAIPEGLEIDHLCNVRCCVNPDHLEAVNHRTNMVRSENTFAGQHARKTHCIKGHEFSKENTYIGRRGGRWCKTCRRAFDKIRRPPGGRR